MLITETRVLELARKHLGTDAGGVLPFARALLAEHEAAKLPATWPDYTAEKAEFIAANPQASAADIEAHAKAFARREGL